MSARPHWPQRGPAAEQVGQPQRTQGGPPCPVGESSQRLPPVLGWLPGEDLGLPEPFDWLSNVLPGSAVLAIARHIVYGVGPGIGG